MEKPILIDTDVILPGPDHRHVRPGDRGNTSVGAAIELHFEFVPERGSVQFVLEFHREVAASLLGIVAGELTARLSDTAVRRPEVGS